MIADAAHEIATQRQMLAIADAYECCAEWAEHRSLPPMLSLTSAETYSAPGPDVCSQRSQLSGAIISGMRT
jgi:hypothetical protein